MIHAQEEQLVFVGSAGHALPTKAYLELQLSVKALGKAYAAALGDQLHRQLLWVGGALPT